jgi:hypothetical protein
MPQENNQTSGAARFNVVTPGITLTCNRSWIFTNVHMKIVSKTRFYDKKHCWSLCKMSKEISNRLLDKLILLIMHCWPCLAILSWKVYVCEVGSLTTRLSQRKSRVTVIWCRKEASFSLVSQRIKLWFIALSQKKSYSPQNELSFICHFKVCNYFSLMYESDLNLFKFKRHWL